MPKYDYYTKEDVQQCLFYQFPQFLLKNKDMRSLSNDAKILYMLMRNRSFLSEENDFVDENNRVYIIFTRDEASEVLNCSKPKATAVFKELTECGLISKRRVGLNKADMIYVHNGAKPIDDDEGGSDTKKEPPTSPENTENPLPDTEVKLFNSRKSKSLTPGSKKSERPDVKNIAPRYKELNNTETGISSSSETYENKDREDDDDKKRLLGYYDVEKTLNPDVAKIVYRSLCLRHDDEISSISKDAFFTLCEKVLENASGVMNPGNYIDKCVDNMLLSISSGLYGSKQKKPKTNQFNDFESHDYNFDEIEDLIIANR